MGADQKYHNRSRHIYGLFFGKVLYVGQSVDLRRRQKEHQRTWSQHFELVRLDTVHGTFAQAEIAEQAWRCLGFNQGYAILAHAGDLGVHVNPMRRRNKEVSNYMKRRQWPKKLRRWHTLWTRVLAWLMVAGVAWLGGREGLAAWHQIWAHVPWGR